MKRWEDLAETLSTEIKREIAQSYFQEKIALESIWKEFEDNYKPLCKKEEELILNACRLTLMLKEENLMEEFQRITHFPLKHCYDPQIIESSNIRKRLFEKLKGLPLAFTSRSRFSKLFLKIYEDLFKAYKAYITLLDDLEEEYRALKEETQKFYKKFDLSSILGFFGRLDEKVEMEITTPEEKDKIYEELRERLRISIPEAPSTKFERYAQPVDPAKIRSQLMSLAKEAYRAHQEYAKDLMSLVSKKS